MLWPAPGSKGVALSNCTKSGPRRQLIGRFVTLHSHRQRVPMARGRKRKRKATAEAQGATVKRSKYRGEI